ncbi:hypothetical protein [Rubritalea tangerina]
MLSCGTCSVEFLSRVLGSKRLLEALIRLAGKKEKGERIKDFLIS